MTYRYLSVCSGIEAFSVAVGEIPEWSPVAFAEIEAFPCAVLAHRFPAVPNLGDMTAIETGKLGRVDWLVAGTPCQSFSNAGLRLSLRDARGNLTLALVRLAHDLQEGNELRGLLWENVPAVLNTPDNAFGCFLGGLVGSGHPLETPGGGRWPDAGMVAGPRARLAWRILNSQHFGVAQRRRRVFVVADFGNGPDPAAVLFEPRGQGRSLEAGGTAREETAGTLTSRPGGGGGLGTDFDLDGGMVPSLTRSARGVSRVGDPRGQDPLVVQTLKGDAHDAGGGEGVPVIVHTLKAEGADASEDGTGRGMPMVVSPVTAMAQHTGNERTEHESLIVAEYVGNAEGGLPEVASISRSNTGKTVNNQTPLVAVFDPNQVTSKRNRSKPKSGLSHTLPATAKPPVVYAIQEGATRENPTSGPDGVGVQEDLAYTLEARGSPAQVQAVGFDWYASESQTLPVLDEAAPPIKSTMQPAVAFLPGQNAKAGTVGASEHVSPTLKAGDRVPGVAYSVRPSNSNKDYTARETEYAQSVTTAAGNPPSARGGDLVVTQQVRRLTPRECERLQGFPDDWTLVPGLKGWREVGDDESLDELRELGFDVRLTKKTNRWRVNDPDGPRYKALGNAFTTEPVNWIMARATALLAGRPLPDWQPMRLWSRGGQRGP